MATGLPAAVAIRRHIMTRKPTALGRSISASPIDQPKMPTLHLQLCIKKMHHTGPRQSGGSERRGGHGRITLFQDYQTRSVWQAITGWSIRCPFGGDGVGPATLSLLFLVCRRRVQAEHQGVSGGWLTGKRLTLSVNHLSYSNQR